MRILTRYFLRAHLAPFLFAFSTLTGLLFVNTIARKFQDFAGKGLGARVILEVMGLSFPHIVALTLPMSVLVAVLYTFSQLAADNEITAMKANGLNLLRLLVPLVIAGTLLALLMVWFNDRILPETNHRLKALTADIGRKNPTLVLKEQVMNPIESGDMRSSYYLRAARIDPATQKLWNVAIYDLTDERVARTIYADSGMMAFNRDHTNLFLRLFNGRVLEVKNNDLPTLQRVFFKEQLVLIRQVSNKFQRNAQDYGRSDREMNLAMLEAAGDSARFERDSVRAEAATLSVLAVRRALQGPVEVARDSLFPGERLPPSAGGMLPVFNARDPNLRRARTVAGGDELAHAAALRFAALASRTESLQDRADQFDVEWHKKFAIPFACIVFVLIGAPIAVRFPRGGAGMVIAISLGVFGIYYMSLIGGEALGDRGKIAPFVGPWGPNLLFLLLAVWGLARIGRETATSRGGGWEDLWITIRSFITPWRRQRSPDRRPAGSEA